MRNLLPPEVLILLAVRRRLFFEGPAECLEGCLDGLRCIRLILKVVGQVTREEEQVFVREVERTSQLFEQMGRGGRAAVVLDVIQIGERDGRPIFLHNLGRDLLQR